MEPTQYERKLQNLMNEVFMAISGGKELSDEGYAADVRERALKADRAFEVLKNELKKGEK